MTDDFYAPNRLYQRYGCNVLVTADGNNVKFWGDDVSYEFIDDNLAYTFRKPHDLLEAAAKYLKDHSYGYEVNHRQRKRLESISFTSDGYQFVLRVYLEDDG